MTSQVRRIALAIRLMPALAVIAVFLGAGMGFAVAQSLGYQPYLPTRPGEGLTLGVYVDLLHDPAVEPAIALTLRVAVASTFAAAVLGTGLALLIHRLGRGRVWAARLVQVNLATPHVVGALAMLLLLSQTGLVSRLSHSVGVVGSPADFPELTSDRLGLGIMLEYVWKETPFISLLVLAALGRASDELGRAARVLGARRWQRFRHVTLPVIAPPLMAGTVLVFAFAVGSYEVPRLLGRPYPATVSALAYEYYTDADLAARPQAMALAMVATVISVAGAAGYVALFTRLVRRPL